MLAYQQLVNQQQQQPGAECLAQTLLRNIRHLTSMRLSEPHHPTETVPVKVTSDPHCHQIQC